MQITRTETYANTIPVQLLSGKRYGYVTAEDAKREAKSGRLEGVYTRKGKLTRLILKPLSAHVVPLMEGGNSQSFVQPMSSGPGVWALKGVTGSAA